METVPKVKKPKKVPYSPMRNHIMKYKNQILFGTMICIDPSSKDMGYAVFKQGKRVESGTWNTSGAVGFRLKRLHFLLTEMLEKHKPDVLALERLRQERKTANASIAKFGHFTTYSPVELIWSVGTIATAWGRDFIEISPSSWKSVAKRLNISKTDTNDAICIGLRCVEIAQDREYELEEQPEPED
jgi:hypothetical protein